MGINKNLKKPRKEMTKLMKVCPNYAKKINFFQPIINLEPDQKPEHDQLNAISFGLL